MQVWDGGNHGMTIGNSPDVERESFAAIVVEQQGNVVAIGTDFPIAQFEEGLATCFMTKITHYLGWLVWVSKYGTHEYRVLLPLFIAHEVGIYSDRNGGTVVIIDQACLELADE